MAQDNAPAQPVALTWDEALEYRKKRLPSYVDPQTGVRHLLSYKSKVGRFCKDTPMNRCCACGDGITSEFVPYGAAITSTFKLQIALISVFAVLSALMIPAITSEWARRPSSARRRGGGRMAALTRPSSPLQSTRTA